MDLVLRKAKNYPLGHALFLPFTAFRFDSNYPVGSRPANLPTFAFSRIGLTRYVVAELINRELERDCPSGVSLI